MSKIANKSAIYSPWLWFGIWFLLVVKETLQEGFKKSEKVGHINSFFYVWVC